MDFMKAPLHLNKWGNKKINLNLPPTPHLILEDMSTKQKGRGMAMGADGRHKTFSVEQSRSTGHFSPNLSFLRWSD